MNLSDETQGYTYTNKLRYHEVLVNTSRLITRRLDFFWKVKKYMPICPYATNKSKCKSVVIDKTIRRWSLCRAFLITGVHYPRISTEDSVALFLPLLSAVGLRSLLWPAEDNSSVASYLGAIREQLRPAGKILPRATCVVWGYNWSRSRPINARKANSGYTIN